jgi:hypothetical protein
MHIMKRKQRAAPSAAAEQFFQRKAAGTNGSVSRERKTQQEKRAAAGPGKAVAPFRGKPRKRPPLSGGARTTDEKPLFTREDPSLGIIILL